MRLRKRISCGNRILVLACRDLWEHERFDTGSIPGYSSLNFSDRLRLDLQSLRIFLCSAAAFRVCSALLIWQLAGYLLVWQLDAQGLSRVAPSLTALLWLLPAVAFIRRRILSQLLGALGYRF
jgi:hypothetical protein